MTEKDLFGTINSTIGGIGAALCSLFGTIVNVMAIVMILKRPKIKKHLTAPILFIMCMSNLTFSLISMPITSYRFFVRANWTTLVCQINVHARLLILGVKVQPT